MFERFTDRARRTITLAQEEARMLDHDYIGTEHILLGLIHEGEGVAAKALESLGISLVDVRADVEVIIGTGRQAPSGHIPFTPRAKKVLELSSRQALQLGHNYIGTEHILLGLIREGEGVACQVLVKRGAEGARVRQQVIQLLSGYQGKKAAEISTAAQIRRLQDRIVGWRAEKEFLIDSQDFPGAADARDKEKHLVAELRQLAPEALIPSSVTMGPMTHTPETEVVAETYTPQREPWFIDLTGHNGAQMVVNLNLVTYISRHDMRTYIYFASGHVVVKETIEEIWGL